MINYTLVTLGFIVLLCSGCSIGKLNSVDDVGPNEVVAVGRARVIYNGRDVTKGSNLVFNAPTNGFPKYQCLLDEDGYIFTKLPREYVSLTNIVCNAGFITESLSKDQLVVNLQNHDKVCYIGDLNILWNGIDVVEAERRGSAAALGIRLPNEQGNKSLTISVKSRNINAIQKEFQLRYKNNLQVVNANFKSKTQ